MTTFYKKALALFTKTQEAQIEKGLAKYPEPFNPFEWTPEELLNHALEEVVDTTHYLVGLKDLLDAKDKDLDSLYKAWSDGLKLIKEKDQEILRLKSLLAKVPADTLQKAYDKVHVPKYFDPDDQ